MMVIQQPEVIGQPEATMIQQPEVIVQPEAIIQQPESIGQSEAIIQKPEIIEQLEPMTQHPASDSSDSNTKSNEMELLNFNGDVKGSLVGVRAKGWQELHQLYKNHSNVLGFGIRKGTEHKNKSGFVTDKYFHCKCRGFKTEKKNKATSSPLPVHAEQIPISSPIEKGSDDKLKKRKRNHAITRTGCNAGMRAKFVKKDGVFEVVFHCLEHNHEMTSTYLNHFEKSKRRISEANGMLIEQFKEAGIRRKDDYNALLKATGGKNSVSHTRKDCFSYESRFESKKIEMGDAQHVLDTLSKLKTEDSDFYYSLELSEGARLKSIFYRDVMMKKDFELFGDLVIFDTTYNTIKNGMICAPIVGINHHGNIVIFGFAFISNESEKTFEWVLREFVASMGGKEPKTLFTDQDDAMANAIQKVFEGRTKHRLCIWHIQQNAGDHFGNLKRDNAFKELFDHCLMGCSDEVEFEQCWAEMMEKYNLWDESWFKKLYGTREKWCSGLSKDFFSAGLLSSQRSVSMNHTLKFEANRTTSLSQFFEIFDKTVQCWRSLETKKEFDSLNAESDRHIYGGLVKHAAELYTIEIFKYFLHEAKAAFPARYSICQYTDSRNIVFKIAHEKNPERFETVTYEKTQEEGIKVECSCNHYRAVGWLCFHAIKVLSLNNIDYIPERYINKRWTKLVKMEVWNAVYQGKITSSVNLSESQSWRQYMAKKYYDLMVTCQENPTAKRMLEDSFNTISFQIQEFLSSNCKESNFATVSSVADGQVTNPVGQATDPGGQVSSGQ